MGTRNVTAVILDGEKRVCQYCQWDGYPTWAGAHIMEFLKDCDFEQFKKALLNTKITVVDYDDAVCYTGSTKDIEEVSGKIYKARTELRDANPKGDYPSNEDAIKNLLEKGTITEQEAEDFYVSTRDTGCDILPYIYNRSFEKPPLEIFAMKEEFNGEYSFDIQGVYILDLDKMTLDMTYNGFNKVFDINIIPSDIDREMYIFEKCIRTIEQTSDYGELNVKSENLSGYVQDLTEKIVESIKNNEDIEHVTKEDLAYMKEFAEKYIKETLELRLNKEEQKSLDNTIAEAVESTAENKTEESVNRSEIEME